MKKALSLILVLALCLTLCACGGDNGEHVTTEQERVEQVVRNRAIASANVKFDYQISGQTTANITYSRETSSNVWEVAGNVTVKDKYGTPHTYSFDATVQYDEATDKAPILNFN